MDLDAGARHVQRDATVAHAVLEHGPLRLTRQPHVIVDVVPAILVRLRVVRRVFVVTLGAVIAGGAKVTDRARRVGVARLPAQRFTRPSSLMYSATASTDGRWKRTLPAAISRRLITGGLFLAFTNAGPPFMIVRVR